MPDRDLTGGLIIAMAPQTLRWATDQMVETLGPEKLKKLKVQYDEPAIILTGHPARPVPSQPARHGHLQRAEQRVRSPHRNPTGPGRDGVSPQVSHRQIGIPRHTAAPLLRWPCRPVTSLYADQAGWR